MTHRPFTLRARGGATLLLSGAALAVAAWATSFLAISVVWLIPLAVVALYLLCLGYLRRFDAERRSVQEMAELHLATVEALAVAVDAKDQTAPDHTSRIQGYAAGLARVLPCCTTSANSRSPITFSPSPDH
jgi:hypothetical protein